MSDAVDAVTSEGRVPPHYYRPGFAGGGCLDCGGFHDSPPKTGGMVDEGCPSPKRDDETQTAYTIRLLRESIIAEAEVHCDCGRSYVGEECFRA